MPTVYLWLFELLYLIAITNNKKVAISKILPTVDAFTQHLKKVYLQVQNLLHGGRHFKSNRLGMETCGKFFYFYKDNTASWSTLYYEFNFLHLQKDCGNSCGCRTHRLICNLAYKNCAACNCSDVGNYLEKEPLSAAQRRGDLQYLKIFLILLV